MAAAWVCALVTALAVLPLLAEVLSAFTGDHLWTSETLVYGVLPTAAIVVAWILAWSARRAASLRSAVMRATLSIVIAIAGCVPLFVLFVTLVNLTFRPGP